MATLCFISFYIMTPAAPCGSLCSYCLEISIPKLPLLFPIQHGVLYIEESATAGSDVKKSDACHPSNSTKKDVSHKNSRGITLPLSPTFTHHYCFISFFFTLSSNTDPMRQDTGEETILD
ncbi:hypothetical protein ILYODFUR_033263 [Ilyodon furcidens]|uniref:Secreted protein n=1 Tax=Ilyodon furcidens TaxID=33524 RepID=A0ABV0SRK2_9TELE